MDALVTARRLKAYPSRPFSLAQDIQRGLRFTLDNRPVPGIRDVVIRVLRHLINLRDSGLHTREFLECES